MNVSELTADQWYRQGNECRKRQDWQGAMNCYQEAINLNPSSPAVYARQMLVDIIEHYNKDMYNP